jgi:hypothetical protein
VSDRPPRTSISRIYQLDRVLARDPDDVAARFERAGLHREQGAYEAAKQDYLELLRRRPTDFGALNDFGTMVLTAGYKEAARSLFSEAVRHHPDKPMGRVNLGNLLVALDEFEEARAHFEAALRADPDHIHAHRGMGNVLAEIGDALGARVHRDKGFTRHYLTPLPFRGDWAPIRVLLLVSANGGNTPTASLLDDRLFQITVLVTEYYYAKGPLPAHDVVFNAIGDADICSEGLEAACDIIRRTSRPVINHPRAVMKTGRAANADVAAIQAYRARRGTLRCGAGLPLSAAAARAGLSHRPPFRPRRKSRRPRRRGGRIARRQGVADRAARCPRR